MNFTTDLVSLLLLLDCQYLRLKFRREQHLYSFCKVAIFKCLLLWGEQRDQN